MGETNGQRELRRSQSLFEQDLKQTFGERYAEFSVELKDLLFEFWTRARANTPPEFWAQIRANQEENPVEQLIEQFDVHPELRRAAMRGTLTVSNDLLLSEISTGVELSLAQPLIPEYRAGEDFNLQNNLQARLEVLGVAPPDTLPGGGDDYLPVAMDRKTGEVIAYQHGQLMEVKSVRAVLHPNTESPDRWTFPDPQPLWDSMSQEQPHVRITVDNEVQVNTECLWFQTYRHGRHVVEAVKPSYTASDSEVLAQYNVVQMKP